MFGFLPAWASDLMVIGAFLLGPSGLIWAILQSRGANRHLVVEEGTLKKSEFDSITQAQSKLLEDARAEAAAAKREADEANDRLDTMDELYDQMRDVVHRLRSLFRRVVSKSGYSMTDSERAEFENTKPVPRPPRIRK